MSNNLNLTQVTAGQNQKEVTINQQSGEIDAAITEPFTSDYTSGDETLTDAEFRGALTFVSSNLTVARNLFVPAIRHFFVVDNAAGSNTLTVDRGTTTFVVPAGENRTYYTDGSANGLIELGGGSGGTLSIQEAGAPVVAAATAVNFDGDDFNVTDEGSDVAGIALAVPNPIIVGGGSDWEVIDSQVVSAVSDVDVTFDPTLWAELEWTIYGAVPASDGTTPWLRVSTDGGATFVSTGNAYDWGNRRVSVGASDTPDGGDDANEIELSHDAQSFTSSEPGNFVIKAFNLGDSGAFSQFRWLNVWVSNTSGDQLNGGGGGQYSATTVVDALRFRYAAGNVASGTFILRGRRADPVPSVQTTDATVTSLFEIPVPSGSSVTIQGFGSGIEDSTGDTFSFEYFASARNQGGTTTIKGVTLTKQDPDATGFDVTVDADDTGDVIRLRVTGAGGTTVDWLTNFRILENTG